MNYIYCYTNLINGKVYIGQTNNIERRIREHKSNAFNDKSVNYNNIIHKAFRKYGYENFSIDILETLENASREEVNEREIYWIKEKHSLISENGYNVLEGGRNGYQKSLLSQEQIADIKQMIKKKTPYDNICKKYSISKTFVSDINNGRFFHNDQEIYPLCAYRLDKDLYDLLIEDLQKPLLTFSQLADKYSIAQSTVKKFNYGTLRHGEFYKGEYPIRKITPQDYKAELIIDYLLNTDYTKKEIIQLVGTSDETIRKINLGIRHYHEDLTYPLR